MVEIKRESKVKDILNLKQINNFDEFCLYLSKFFSILKSNLKYEKIYNILEEFAISRTIESNGWINYKWNVSENSLEKIRLIIYLNPQNHFYSIAFESLLLFREYYLNNYLLENHNLHDIFKMKKLEKKIRKMKENKIIKLSNSLTRIKESRIKKLKNELLEIKKYEINKLEKTLSKENKKINDYVTKINKIFETKKYLKSPNYWELLWQNLNRENKNSKENNYTYQSPEKCLEQHILEPFLTFHKIKFIRGFLVFFSKFRREIDYYLPNNILLELKVPDSVYGDFKINNDVQKLKDVFFLNKFKGKIGIATDFFNEWIFITKENKIKLNFRKDYYKIIFLLRNFKYF